MNMKTNENVVQVRTRFHFTADLAYPVAAPLFGALAEQKWAEGWKPMFLYPDPPADQEGAVFRVERPGDSSVWTATVFDLPGGHVQYLVVLNNVILTRIDIRLARNGDQKTDVSVLYERTAIDPSFNDEVRVLAKRDEGRADEWRNAINACGARMKSAP
ncbi:MAG TPA: hypothetical protein VIX89_01485 [Bryobacteraceae bacterium]